jgi:hypothetical protein
MKKLMITALLGGQLLIVAQPALAADFVATRPERVGAFGGLRVRVPLGGNLRHRHVRAGLAIAPTRQGVGMQDERALHIGEGIELGYRSSRRLALSVAGVDVRQVRPGAAQDDGTEDEEGGSSTLLIIGGVVVVLAAAAAVGWTILVREAGEID